MKLSHRLLALAIAACPILAPSAALAGPTLVFDMNTGEILHDNDATASWHPASLTKMMTAHLALRAIKEGRLSLNTPIVFSEHASSQPPSKLGVQPGHGLVLHDALKIMLTRSTNDVATAIGEAIAGNETTFAQLMTLEAKSIGMTATRFANANGLYDPSQVTTARDLAILAMAIHKQHPEYLYLFGIKELPYKDKVLKNTNRLLKTYPGMNGMKTGFICASGFNIVTSVQRNGRTFGAIVLGEPSVKAREAKVEALLNQTISSPSRGQFNVLTYGRHQERPATNLKDKICGSQPIATNTKQKGKGKITSGKKSKSKPTAAPKKRAEKTKRF